MQGIGKEWKLWVAQGGERQRGGAATSPAEGESPPQPCLLLYLSFGTANSGGFFADASPTSMGVKGVTKGV